MVMWSTDNGAASNSWPDGGNHPFKLREGCRRVRRRIPGAVRRAVAGRHSRRRPPPASSFRWRTGFRRSVELGQPKLAEQLRKDAKIPGKTYKVHLDGVRPERHDHR